MKGSATTLEGRRSYERKYLWPTPVGLLLWVGCIIVPGFLGDRAFLATHGYFEIGVMISLIASVVYAVRLGGKGKGTAPRWVFYLNFLFLPLVLGSWLVAWIAFDLFK